jgi:hypothetical protein
MITLKSVGHFFAKAYKAIVAEIPKVEATAPAVEAVSAKVPVYGPLAVTIEQAGYALLGEVSAVLNAGGAAVKAKLADAGLDVSVIDTVEAIVAGYPAIAAVAKTL